LRTVRWHRQKRMCQKVRLGFKEMGLARSVIRCSLVVERAPVGFRKTKFQRGGFQVRKLLGGPDRPAQPPAGVPKEKAMKYTAVYTRDEDGGWVAQCAEVPAAITEGDTLAEARENLRYAICVVLRFEAKHILAHASRGAKIEGIAV
jgi:predicted RNase H-like HicB family nuclease